MKNKLNYQHFKLKHIKEAIDWTCEYVYVCVCVWGGGGGCIQLRWASTIGKMGKERFGGKDDGFCFWHVGSESP